MAETNWGPRSEVRWAGTPKREIQWVMRASAQSEAVMEVMGMASGHLVVRSTTVNKYSAPAEGGKGPTRSTWRWLHLLAGTGMACTGVFEWRVTLPRWQSRQVLDQARESEAIEGHRNRREMRALVVRPLGWARPWTESKTCRRR